MFGVFFKAFIPIAKVPEIGAYLTKRFVQELDLKVYEVGIVLLKGR